MLGLVGSVWAFATLAGRMLCYFGLCEWATSSSETRQRGMGIGDMSWSDASLPGVVERVQVLRVVSMT